KLGPNGLCGPCSEIFYDWGPGVGCGKPGCEPACSCHRFCEVWNLVFQQYDRQDVDKLVTLPTKNIDTGMGLERIAAVMQGKMSNYDIDIFQPILRQIERETGMGYENVRAQEAGARFRRIADHVRGAAFCIADGILPGRAGRGYVLRKMIRRAVRDALFLGCQEPMLYRLVPVIAQVMPTYPEIAQRRENIGRILRIEEEKFHVTLKRGAAILDKLVAEVRGSGQEALEGRKAFKLFDTYGFSAEDAESMLDEAGVKIDMDGFRAAMEEQRARSRASAAVGGDIFGRGPLADIKAEHGETEFAGYDTAETDARVLAIVCGGEQVESVEAGAQAAVALDRTPFYAQSGGQVGDTGLIECPAGAFEVADTQKFEGVFIHVGKVARGTLAVGYTVRCRPDTARQNDIRRNHTATHLLHKALRQVLGDTAEQAGSLVAPDRLRFDFTHAEALTEEQLTRVEEIVNEQILAGAAVAAARKSLQEAKASGAIALFGEKYGDVVRMVTIGDFSRELCGGLHCQRVSDIGFFKILSESSVAAGVRRIEAVTGMAAARHAQQTERALRAVSRALKTPPERAVEAVEQLQEQVKSLRKELQEARQRAGSGGDIMAGAKKVGDTVIVAKNMGEAGADTVRGVFDQLRQKNPSLAAVLGAMDKGKPFIIVALTRNLLEKGLNAGALVNKAGRAMGGGGGGRPDMAQAGGKDASKLDEAIQAAAQEIESTLAAK
ncbi:MAG TPA: alanine--tRNA ligase, partial [Candidatus Brocadiia bacterium]|nr:alanine--tRNA ligase [Candidatus Brocadiia bacterium]